jgi:uncharacterized protein YeeX (DUF496 family)
MFKLDDLMLVVDYTKEMLEIMNKEMVKVYFSREVNDNQRRLLVVQTANDYVNGLDCHEHVKGELRRIIGAYRNGFVELMKTNRFFVRG